MIKYTRALAGGAGGTGAAHLHNQSICREALWGFFSGVGKVLGVRCKCGIVAFGYLHPENGMFVEVECEICPWCRRKR
jgi:hypothetical protein